MWPDFIKKKRAPRGVASYEIVWKDDQKCFEGLIPTKQVKTYISMKGCANDEDALQSLWSTIEPIELVEKVYPDLVEKYVQSKIKPKKTKANARKPAKRTKKIADGSLHDMSSLQQALDEIDVAEVKSKSKGTKKNTRKSPKIKKAKVTLQTLDKFFRQNANVNTEHSSSPPSIDSANTVNVPTKTIDLSNFSMDFNDAEGDNFDLSQIIDDMVSKRPTIIEIGGKKLRFDEIKIDRTTSPSPIQTDDDLDNGIGFGSSKENVKVNEVNGNGEESFDEFDLIVMGKGRTNPSKNQANEQIKSSTPVLIDRFLKKHSINGSARSSGATQDTVLSSPNAEANAVVTSSFFSVAADDDVDLFEQSIDFKNMEDVDLVVSDSSVSDDSSDSSDESVAMTVDAK